MPESVAFSNRAKYWGRWALIAMLLLTLFFLGTYDEPVHTLLTALWQHLLAAVGLQNYFNSLQAGVSGGITKRFLPAVATYAVLYLALCLVLLRLLLTPSQWRLALRCYAAAIAIYAVLIVVGRLSGNIPWIYRLARQILDFVFSPLPVGGLYILFQAGFEEKRKP